MTTYRNTNEIIIVRSLSNSDLGIFEAHRPTNPSKQRAININSQIAQRLLSTEIYEQKGKYFDCRLIFGSESQNSKRHIGKVGKNWRLGGKKIEGEEFGKIDSKDFVLIRSKEGNDGLSPITLVFISRSTERLRHARIGRLLEPTIRDSMAIYLEGSAGFDELNSHFPSKKTQVNDSPSAVKKKVKRSFTPMPQEKSREKKNRSIKDKLYSPHILEQMLKVSSDLSAHAQVDFFENIELLATQLRKVLLATKRIIKLDVNHSRVWKAVKGQSIGFVDGGLANLSMLGSAPIAARVGGYVVKPGDKTLDREKFIVLKKLINELYTAQDNTGVYNWDFPDVGALRDAARISMEAAGAVKILKEDPSIQFLFLHGALVNPVSRYTDIMRDGRVLYQFPDFSHDSLKEMLPDIEQRGARSDNFINVYLKQLENLLSSKSSVCGVIERAATTTSAIKATVNNLENHLITDYLPEPPDIWKKWFLSIVEPKDAEEFLGQRITDSLLFRCVLEPNEVLVPIEIDRNILRKAPQAWQGVIANYPKPLVSYLQVNEWSAPIRLEIFNKDLDKFQEIVELILHCSLLLPRYAFPVGLDIVDKFARMPSWMSKPINTNTAVRALKVALEREDERLFDSLRRMLCGSEREWLLRPSVFKK